MSSLADALQILAVFSTGGLIIVGVWLGIYVHKLFLQFSQIAIDISKTAEALLKNGKPISVAGELTLLEKQVKKDIERVEGVLVETQEAQASCFMNQQECMKLQKEFREKPYQMCEKFANCPAVISKVQLVETVKDMIREQFKKENEATQVTQRKIEEALDKADEDRKRIEDKVELSNRVIAAFTKDFGSEVVKAVIRNLSIAKDTEDGRK